MRTLSLSSVTLSLLASSCASHGPNEEVLSPGKELDAQPIRALLVTGGCCHDYDNQKTIITEGISARARVEWTIVHEGGSRSENVRDHKLGVFENQEWADEYDVVVHNTCFGGLRDEDFVGAFVNAHREKGVGAVVLHCGLHSYRNLEGKTWHNFLGIASKRHEKGAPVPVENARPDHPIMATFPESWTTAKDELYVVHETWPGVVPLGLAWGTETKIHHPVIWVNRSGQARVFGTSLGHSNETMENPIYLDLIARGLLWAVGKLDEGGNPLEGYEAAPAPAPAEE